MPKLDRAEIERLVELSGKAFRHNSTGPEYADFSVALINWFAANSAALLELEQDARRWRFLEHGCQWVSFTPIDGDTRSFDPRVVSDYAGHLQDMRAVVDAGVQRHLGILRAAIDAKLREDE